ncbi:hypothetical protein YQE_10829, partial [Dendroctonus ponderosae]
MVIQEFPSSSSSSSSSSASIIPPMAALHSNGPMMASHGSVANFYNGKTVFITGGTGFMGKVLLEKLLRSCPGVAQIYLLIRPKKGQNAQERLQQLLCSPMALNVIQCHRDSGQCHGIEDRKENEKRKEWMTSEIPSKAAPTEHKAINRKTGKSTKNVTSSEQESIWV